MLALAAPPSSLPRRTDQDVAPTPPRPLTEADLTFVAPEGVYSVFEDHKPTGHTINASPAAYRTKLTSVVVRFPPTKTGNQGLGGLLGVNRDSKKEQATAKATAAATHATEGDGASESSSDTEASPDPVQTVQDADQPTTLFSPRASASGKRRVSRPKHNMRTTSSTFITRLQTTEVLLKSLQTKQGDVTFLFYNSAKSFFWTEVGVKTKEPFARATFAAYPTCHDVNLTTISPEHIDIIIGFHTGDLLWFDPVSARYSRLNKAGCISSSACTAVRWVPNSPNLFIVSHLDGTVIVYDKEREDGIFVPQDPETNGNQWDPRYNIFVTMPPWHHASGYVPPASGKPDKEKAIKNPVSHWRVSRKAIVDFVFSPDVKYVAAISEDGCLRVIDALAEQLVDSYASYFGALTCVAWSPDGRFILTGGQDDLVTIISPWEQRVIARCQGHSSFVSAISFDELRCDGRTYRFGSVGEDNKLILWDFSAGALHRPKLHAAHYQSHQRLPMASTLSLAFRRDPTLGTGSPGPEPAVLPRHHTAPSRSEVAVVQPVLIKHLETDLLSHLLFTPRGVLTSSKTGTIRLWIRPMALRSRSRSAARRQSFSDAQDVL